MQTDGIHRQTLREGVHFTSIPDAKFKNNYLSVSFKLPLKRETAALYALLPMVLRRGCRDYPDMTSINRRLEELYGARLDGGVSKRGEIQIVTFFVEALDDAYALSGEKLLTGSAGLLRSVIFDPAAENGCFRARDVEIEAQNLADLIGSRLNDKRYYASQRLREEMCRDEAYGVSEYGTQKDALAVTPQQLWDAWQRMLQNAEVEIFHVGPGDFSVCAGLLGDSFASVPRGGILPCPTRVIREAERVRTVEEHLPVAQAKLGLGFRAGVAVPDADMPAMQLACTVLGGSPHSKLFANVREKMSLCYYCYARYERLKGLILVESGIEEDNFAKARDEILHQLSQLQAGQVTADELKFAALSLSNSYRELSDTAPGIAQWYLGQALDGYPDFSPAQAARRAASLSVEDIVRAARHIRLATVYLLAGSGKK